MTDLDDWVRNAVREAKQARNDPKKRAKQAKEFTDATSDLRASVEETRRKRVAQQWVPTELVLIVTKSQCGSCGTMLDFPNPHLLVACVNERWGITEMKSVRDSLDWRKQFGDLPKRIEYRTLPADVCLHCFNSIGESHAKAEISDAEEDGHLLHGRADPRQVYATNPESGNGEAKERTEVPDRQHADQQAGGSPPAKPEPDRRERPYAPPSLGDLLGADFFGRNET